MIPGAIGIGIAILWWFTDSRHTPPAQPIADAAPTLPEPVDEGDASIRGLMHDKGVWAILAARLLRDPVWYFYLFWIPGYLQIGRASCRDRECQYVMIPGGAET